MTEETYQKAFDLKVKKRTFEYALKTLDVVAYNAVVPFQHSPYDEVAKELVNNVIAEHFEEMKNDIKMYLRQVTEEFELL